MEDNLEDIVKLLLETPDTEITPPIRRSYVFSTNSPIRVSIFIDYIRYGKIDRTKYSQNMDSSYLVLLPKDDSFKEAASLINRLADKVTVKRYGHKYTIVVGSCLMKADAEKLFSACKTFGFDIELGGEIQI